MAFRDFVDIHILTLRLDIIKRKDSVNECFYEMRKTLNIEPYNFLNNYEQIKEKSKDIYLLVENEEIIGSIACYGNEIDDLIVNKKFQHKGYGKLLKRIIPAHR